MSFQDILKMLLKKVNKIKKEINWLASSENQNCCKVKQEVRVWMRSVDDAIEGKLTGSFH